MTDRVEPSPNKQNKVYATTNAIQWATLVEGWVAPSDTWYVAGFEGMSGAPLDAFDASEGTGAELDIASGEAFVDGRWVARDTVTTVSLADDATGQEIHVGWEQGVTNGVKIDVDSAFGSHDGHVHIWTADTSGGSVTNLVDHRIVGPPLTSNAGQLVANAVVEISEGITLDAPIESDSLEGFDAALQLANGVARYSVWNDWTTIYNIGGNGWRLRGGASADEAAVSDRFWVDSDGDAGLEGEFTFRLENRSSRPSNPDPGRIIYRTDKD